MAIVLAVIAVVVGLCAVDLHCSGDPEAGSSVARVKGEMAEGKKAMRQQEAENLTQVVRSLCELAHRYKANGETKKAQRAIGAARELEKKIAKLLAPDVAPDKGAEPLHRSSPTERHSRSSPTSWQSSDE